MMVIRDKILLYAIDFRLSDGSTYYKLVCGAKQDSYILNNKTISRDQQEALLI